MVRVAPNRPELQTQYDNRGFRISAKGVMRAVKFAKFSEAEERNAKTDPENKRSTWRERGFNRKSHAAMVIRETVREANEMTDAIRARSSQDDWESGLGLDDLADWDHHVTNTTARYAGTRFQG